MTSRRIASNEKALLDEDDNSHATSSTPERSNITPAVPTSVIVKLLGFTGAMVVGPIGTYFLTLNTIYSGNSTWAGATAAIAANVVLIAYIIVAFKDDESDRIKAEENARKKQ